MQVIAGKIVNPDTQSVFEVAGNEEIGIGKQYMQHPKGPIGPGPVYALNSLLEENAEIQARAAKDTPKEEQGNKPAKGTPATGKPAEGTPAKPTSAKLTPTPKTSPKGNTGKCKRQVTMKSSSGQGKLAKGDPAKGKPGGKGMAVKRTYTDFLKPRDAQATPIAFQTVALRV